MAGKPMSNVGWGKVAQGDKTELGKVVSHSMKLAYEIAANSAEDTRLRLTAIEKVVACVRERMKVDEHIPDAMQDQVAAIVAENKELKLKQRALRPAYTDPPEYTEPDQGLSH